MPNEIREPSQLAIDHLLSRIDEDENIPAPIKQALSSAIPTREVAQIRALRSSIAEWAENDENPEHPAK